MVFFFFLLPPPDGGGGVTGIKVKVAMTVESVVGVKVQVLLVEERQ